MEKKMVINFFELTGMENDRNYAEWDSVMEFDQVTCPIEPDKHMRAGKRSSDLSVLLRGTQTDIIRTWYYEFLLQSHVVDIFKKEGLTGFELKPVKAKFKKKSDQPIPQLWELVVTGWGGVAGDVNLTYKCEGCGMLRYTVPKDMSKFVTEWDGSDFFVVWPLPKYVIVTQKVVDVIKKYNLKGCVFKNIMQLDFSESEDLSPGRLRNRMPEKRAKEIGERLGIY
jgi:hypothetical protein